MLPRYLLPETDARQDGAGTELSLEKSGMPLLLTLGITRTIEQANLEVSIWGSPDGAEWRQMAFFPRKSYCGTYSMVLDLAQYPEVRRLRAQWSMSRWSGSGEDPLFGFYLLSEEVRMRRAGAA